LSDITKPKILDLLRDIKEGTTPISRKRKGRRGAPYMANATYRALRRFFYWCVEEDRLATSPMTTIKPPAEQKERERVLSDAELKLVWECAGAFPYGPLVRLLMLTGARRDEVGQMTRDEIAGEVWEIPGSRTKNGRPHRIPLTAQARDLIEKLPKMGSGSLCFTKDGKRAFNSYSQAKVELDELIAQAGAKMKVPPWVLHDIRRTVASGLARLGIQPIVISALLNHSPKRLIGITSVYARYGYDAEKRHALEAWCAHLDRVLAGTR
jgi:integrase